MIIFVCFVKNLKKKTKFKELIVSALIYVLFSI
jgi:hypothetical protein